MLWTNKSGNYQKIYRIICQKKGPHGWGGVGNKDKEFNKIYAKVCNSMKYFQAKGFLNVEQLNEPSKDYAEKLLRKILDL